MSTTSYLTAWIWYLSAVVVLIGVWWYWTRKLPVFARYLVRALPVAWALMPWSVQLDHQRLAPAWLIAIFEGLFREGGSGWRAGAGVILATVVALLLVAISWWLARRRRAADEVDPADIVGGAD